MDSLPEQGEYTSENPILQSVLDEIAEELDGKVKICKVDVDNNSELAGTYNIRAIPALLIFKNGKKADEIMGMTNKSDLVAKIEAQF